MNKTIRFTLFFSLKMSVSKQLAKGPRMGWKFVDPKKGQSIYICIYCLKLLFDILDTLIIYKHRKSKFYFDYWVKKAAKSFYEF